MKTITLCAGMGSRLRPLTNTMPKCLVPFNGTSILSRQLATFNESQLAQNYIISGYMRDKITLPVEQIYNPNYSSTNMVYSLALARDIFDGSEDIIMSYGDIIFQKSIIDRLKNETADIVVVSDLNWEEYWAERFDDYWHDVESFSTDQSGLIKSIGQPWTNKMEIQGQYIGLVKFSKSIQVMIAEKLEMILNNDELHNLYMTDFLQSLVDEGNKVSPMYIKSGWLEFDQTSDLDKKFLRFLDE